MIQDGTGKTAKEILDMSPSDRRLTALVRARFYKMKKKASERAQQ